MEVAGDPMFYTHVGAAMGEQEPVTKHTLICYMMTKKLQFSPGKVMTYRSSILLGLFHLQKWLGGKLFRIQVMDIRN